MRLEFLLQFIVPLTFLAIWALTSLLNRDAQPLPPRPGAGRGPGVGPGRVGPGAGAGGGFSPSARAELARAAAAARPSPSAAERTTTTTTRWASAPGPARPGSVPTRAVDDGIVIIESESRASRGSSTFSPSAAASGGRTARGTGTSARRASRARSTPAAPIRPMEPERRRALTGLTGQPLGQKQGKALEIAPLATPIAPISSAPLTTSSQSPAPEVARTAAAPDVPTLSVADLRAMLASPQKIREVALLGELLQPPVSMRGPRRGR